VADHRTLGCGAHSVGHCYADLAVTEIMLIDL
jgi:hypothetical protein